MEKKEKPEKGKSRISQSDVPAQSLAKALRVAQAIFDNYGKDPAKPLWVAQAMNMSPSSGPFRTLTGTSVAYGLTDGAYNAAEISLTPLARRILSPMEEGDDLSAKREATLKPRVINEFLNKYNDSPLPTDAIACNVLTDMGVPRERTTDVLELIKECAQEVGFFREIKGKMYVDFKGITPKKKDPEEDVKTEDDLELPTDESIEDDSDFPKDVKIKNPEVLSNKVFITHGKNSSFIEPIRKLLAFGGFEAVVAAEKQTVSMPVPEKVMQSMRSCGAAIIHVDAEMKLIDEKANEQIVLNPNVLIEIGAAMALYGQRFILLVKDGVKLPSNLQGLYEVRYTGDSLDSDVTIKLLEAIQSIKTYQLPS